jgi:uncharacterized protein YbbC (DUF1343 family)
MIATLRLFACFSIVAAGMVFAAEKTESKRGNPPVTTHPIRTGAQSLADSRFAILAGRRVGLITNHTARVGADHLADLLHAAPDVTLVALFGPEHGVRGTADASESVPHGRDEKTGVPVYSLYGKTRAPTKAMLRGIDVLVFDIQDVGARFYTFISTMGLAMQAAARARIRFVVLDRPNPLGGDYVAGFSVARSNISFVSQYPVPLAHGLTVGELARMIKGEKMLPGLERLELDVVAMEGWSRDMQWPDTGLQWVPTSPNIPDFETALVYPGTGLFEATVASEGRGTDRPFRLLGAPWTDGEALASALNARALAGVRFEAAAFTPRRVTGMAADPKARNKKISGVRVVVTDARTYLPVETGVHILHAFRQQARNAGRQFINRPDWLAKLAGRRTLNGMLRRSAMPARIVAQWREDVDRFRRRRARYLLYQ